MMAHLHLTKEMQNKQQQQQQHNNNKSLNESDKMNSNNNNNDKNSAEDRNEGTPLSPPLSSLAMAFNERVKVRLLVLSLCQSFSSFENLRA